MICAARLSAWAITSAACALASRMLSPAFLAASSSSCLPRSAAAKQSAICFLRVSSAFMIVVHTNFLQNHTKKMNVMDWPIKVALKFISAPFNDGGSPRPVATRELTGNGEQNVHGQTDSDHRHGVDQTHDDEELGTQHRDQLGLTGCTLEEAATEDADTDGCTERAQAHHQGASDVQYGLSHFHMLLLEVKIKVENKKPEEN